MIGVLGLALAVAAPAATGAPEPSVPPPDDIVVRGERVRNLRITTKKDRATGAKRCIVKPSIGDADVDAQICAAYLACAPEAQTAREMEACLLPPLTALLRGYGERIQAEAAARP